MSSALLIGAALIVLLKTWQGWRLGLVRQVLSMAAVLVATGVGIFAAPVVGAALRSVLPFPEQVLAPVGGLLLGLAVFAAIGIVGAILFKKTSDQGLAVVRIGYGLAGAAIGAFYGVLVVAAFALGLRLLGSVAETMLAFEKNPNLTARRSPTAMAVRLAALRHSMDESAAGAVLRWVDPIPETTYSTLNKLAQLLANAKSMQRLLGYPGIRTVMDHPKVVALLSDRAVNKAIDERRYLLLLSNPRVVAAADDPDVAARLRAIDFDAALDFALRAPGSGSGKPNP